MSVSYVCEKNVYFYVVVFSKSMSCKYFHVRSNFCLIDFEYFQGKTLHVEGNKILKANLKCTYRFPLLLNINTVSEMCRTDII